MVANISPNSGSCEHSLNTLRYADRVKELKKGPGGGGAAAGVKYDAYMPHHGKQGRRTYEDSSSGDVYQPPPVAAASPLVPQASLAQKQSVSGIPKPASRPSLSSQQEAASLPSSKPFVKPLASALKGHHHASPADEVQNDQLMQTIHDDLCSDILREEESIVEAHRGQIDSTMRGVKEEMELLKRFDMKGFDTDDYVNRLDDLLTKKMNGIQELKAKLQLFKQHLKDEEELERKLSESRKRRANGNDPWGRPTQGQDEDDQDGQQQYGQHQQGRNAGPAGPSYPHLAPLPGNNYNR